MAATAALAISALSSLASANSQSQAMKAQGEFAKQQAEQNARLSELQAKEAEQAGEKEANLHRKKVRAMVGSQKAALAAQGIDIGSGTALDVFGETAELGEQDAATIRTNAYKQAYGLRQHADITRQQGQFDYMAAKYDAKNTMLTGGLKAISGGFEAYGNYSKDSAPSTVKKKPTGSAGSSNKNYSGYV